MVTSRHPGEDRLLLPDILLLLFRPCDRKAPPELLQRQEVGREACEGTDIYLYMNNINNLIHTLKRKKIKISCAESCTGGLLASSITSIGGASKVFNLGLVTYSNQAKIKILKVNKNIIKKYGAVSHQCCISMVNNLSKISNP